VTSDASEVFYLLVCRDCGNGDLVMPFGSAEERGKWAAGHTRLTGHDRWWVKDFTRASSVAGGSGGCRSR
jgi:hypothetical protein